MSRIRTNITIHPGVREQAQAIMDLRKFDEFSDLLATLIREEYDRRIAPPGGQVKDLGKLKQELAAHRKKSQSKGSQ